MCPHAVTGVVWHVYCLHGLFHCGTDTLPQLAPSNMGLEGIWEKFRYSNPTILAGYGESVSYEASLSSNYGMLPLNMPSGSLLLTFLSAS